MILVLVGPTAAGKSGVAVHLAELWTAAGRPTEIVNADSMLVYRGMDIGTAKPTPEERARVPHHLVDILDVSEAASVADFQRLARQAIADCRERGVLPLVVGGSALYVRAIVDDFRFPGTDPALRAALEDELDRVGPEVMHRRLAAIDPAAAVGIEPANGRRVVRALEVGTLTDAPYAATLPPYRYALDDVVQIGITWDRESLDRRIAHRVDLMWRHGLVAEVKRLAERGLRDGRTASRALGYRQVLQHLDGEISEDEARSRTITQTRKFARRQQSWFRRDPRIAWVAGEAASNLAAGVRALLTGDADVPH